MSPAIDADANALSIEPGGETLEHQTYERHLPTLAHLANHGARIELDVIEEYLAELGFSRTTGPTL